MSSAGAEPPAGAARPAREGGAPAARPSPTPRTAREMLELARAFLARRELPEARLEAELLVAHALGLDRLGLFLRLDQPVQAGEVDAARELLVRRGRREPTAYLVGAKEFYGRPFAVDARVLIPRPETELLVDLAREHGKARAGERPLRVADLGTGSGCLAVTLALELPGCVVLAVDASEDALAVATENARRLAARVDFRAGDGVEVLRALVAEGGPLDLLVCNPPYVRPEEAAALAPEVREHEPAAALFEPAGERDLWVRRLVAAAPELLAPDGVVLLELGHEQGPRALSLARGAGLSAALHRDLAGVERVLELRRA